MTLEQLHDRLSQWGRWFRCGESDIRRLAGSILPVTYDERELSTGPNILAKMRQENDWTPPERSWATEPPLEARQIEAAVVDCGRYYKAPAVILRAAYCWPVGMNARLEVLGSLAPCLFDEPRYALKDGSLRKPRYFEALRMGEAFVLAKLDQVRRVA